MYVIESLEALRSEDSENIKCRAGDTIGQTDSVSGANDQTREGNVPLHTLLTQLQSCRKRRGGGMEWYVGNLSGKDNRGYSGGNLEATAGVMKVTKEEIR